MRWRTFDCRRVGSAGTMQTGRTQVNYIGTRKRKHSRKPDEQYALIESCSPGPFLELFARGERPGWAVWGNQADESYTPHWPNFRHQSRRHLDDLFVKQPGLGRLVRRRSAPPAHRRRRRSRRTIRSKSSVQASAKSTGSRERPTRCRILRTCLKQVAPGRLSTHQILGTNALAAFSLMIGKQFRFATVIGKIRAR